MVFCFEAVFAVVANQGFRSISAGSVLLRILFDRENCSKWGDFSGYRGRGDPKRL